MPFDKSLKCAQFFVDVHIGFEKKHTEYLTALYAFSIRLSNHRRQTHNSPIRLACVCNEFIEIYRWTDANEWLWNGLHFRLFFFVARHGHFILWDLSRKRALRFLLHINFSVCQMKINFIGILDATIEMCISIRKYGRERAAGKKRTEKPK